MGREGTFGRLPHQGRVRAMSDLAFKYSRCLHLTRASRHRWFAAFAHDLASVARFSAKRASAGVGGDGGRRGVTDVRFGR